MRTYSRKKVEYKMIEGVKERCRLCLGKSEEVVPIFTDSSEVCAALPMRIMICIGLEMVREDCLSNMICKNCHDELERYYSFRKKCEVTYQKLKAHVTFMKEQAVIAEHAKKSEVKAREEATERRVEFQLQNEVVDERKLVLTFNEGELHVVDVVNWNGITVTEKPEDLVNNHMSPIQIKEQEQIIDNEVQMQDTTTASRTSMNETAAQADMSTLITSILLRLGILSQEGELLEVADHTFQELELEAEDGERITLELVEEDSSSLATSIVEECPEPEVPLTDDLRLVMETVEPPPATQTENQQPNKKTSKTAKNAEGKQVAGGAWCSLCGKLYSSRSALSRHVRAHSAARPYACPRCGRAFTQKAVLARHLLVHEADRPFKCPSCEKSFTQRGALQSHARLHAAPHARALALHRCGSCPKVFLYASGLSRHMSVHEGRVFQCAECGRKFRDKSALTRHLKNADHKKHRPS